MTKFIEGFFIDFAGEKHKFVIAGTVIKSKSNDKFSLVYNDKFDRAMEIQKVLNIGISIHNPIDKYDSEIGKVQAKGRSEKVFTYTVTFSKSGMCSDFIVDSILQQHKNELISNPGKFIPGYNEMEKRWKKTCSKEHSQKDAE